MLYRDCKHDAKTICHANDWGEDKESMLPNNFVISCLYRNAILHENPKHKVNLYAIYMNNLPLSSIMFEVKISKT